MFAFGRALGFALALAALPAAAQGGKVEVTLTNTLAEEVSVIVAAPDGSSTREAGKIAPGAVAKIQASPTEYVMLTTGGAPFQNYAVTDAAAQAVSVAKPGAAPAAAPAATPEPAPAPTAPTVAETPPAPPATTEAPPSAPAATSAAPEPTPAAPSADAAPPAAAPDSSATVAPPSPETAPTEQAGPLMGPADVNGLRWQFSKLEGAKAQLVFGVPETDNVQFVATCAARAKSVDVEFALGVGERKNGAKFSLELQGEAYKAKLAASVLAPSSGEGLSGVKARVAASDKLWEALASERAISYGAGGDRLRLPLDGSRPVVEAFSAHCSGQKPLSPSAALCKKAARLKSTSGGPKVDVTFVNASNEYRVVFWIDPGGQQVEMGRLESEGGKLPLSTWAGHMFVLTDGPGNCIEVLTATAGASVIDVSAKSPGFGPE